MRLLRMILSVRMFLIVIVSFLTWQIWVFSRPRPAPLTPAEAAAVEKACTDAASRIQQAAPPPARIGIATLVGDDTGQVTASLKLRLATVAGYEVLAESPIRRFLADVSEAVANATNPEEIMRAGQSAQMDVVVAGHVLAIDQTNESGRISMHVLAYDTRPGKLAVNETLNAQWTPTWTDKAATSIAGISPLVRWILWLIAVGLLPWLSSFAVVWAVEKKSNAASLALISIHVVVGMALWFILFRPTFAGAGEIVKLLFALILCAGYDFWACESIAAKQKTA